MTRTTDQGGDEDTPVLSPALANILRPELASLQVHPQTVRYRIRQLERTLGDQFGDPDARFAMEMVLRVMRLREKKFRGSRESGSKTWPPPDYKKGISRQLSVRKYCKAFRMKLAMFRRGRWMRSV